MKKRRILPINIINLTMIVSVMIIVAMLNQNVIRNLSMRDISNVTHLTEAHIYAAINDVFAEPVNTSLIMAQNTLLKTIMNGEDPETEGAIATYLSAIQEATGYESVFLVPHATLNYYYPGGTETKLDLNQEDAYWYLSCMTAQSNYQLNVNTEQLDNNALTVYVNAVIHGDQGEFLGLTGVGKRVVHLQDILGEYKENQGIEAYLVDGDGGVQVHTNPRLIQTASVYDLENIRQDAYNLFSTEEVVTQHQIGHKIIITHRLPSLDWYLVVSKSTSDLSALFYRNSLLIYGALVLGATMMMGATSITIARYKKQIIQLSNTDILTDVPNRAIFDKTLKSAVKGLGKKGFTLVLFDLDNLKTINDSLGHDMGDFALTKIAGIASRIIQAPDVLARIGGDEFGIILFRDLEASRDLMVELMTHIESDGALEDIQASISLGMTFGTLGDTESMIFKRADEALYEAKATGKGQISSKL